jgi:ABC-type phosphate transport system substrate-binding protein
MHKPTWLGRKSAKLALAAAVAGGLGLTMASPAMADYGPAPLDVVGAGSDTVQNIMNFAADGKGNLTGFNSAGNKYKLVSLDATGDANDRSVYASGGTSPLKLSVIYRAGKSPQQRANGSGSGIAAMLQDTTIGAGETINFVRMSRLPNSTEIGQADTINGWGGLHVIKIATDDLVMAAASASTNAVPLTADQLVHVYQCDAGFTDWHDLNPAAPAGSTIIPEAPQSGSGTGGTFIADMTAAKGSAFSYGSCVKITEENDPAAITSPPGGGSAANAIQPLSSGRKALFDSGYFHDPSVAFPTGTALTSGIQLFYGSGGAAQTPNACVKPTAPGQTLDYCNTRGLYLVWRHNDDTFGTPWQPGSTRNWVQTLFWRGDGTNPYIKTGGGQAAIAAGGVTATYVDCGIDPTSC